ncbi:glycine betaine ABC transporter substrate-binding protein [Vreelandella zhaodongensis]|uniref:Glycine betaine ABC transporter substrate-binding protein n=1 Tax=Vreelandella zhaodongensis TaxID=1176240 RepID=A0ABX2SRB9_VREZH|nr:glycine betaine ABC transporter substrate-binding protein [Halomonas zhaodongensis]NYS44662.1 glycine betaine ABC transporter substrate-binding protein [Halomonas zhaodongensis]
MIKPILSVLSSIALIGVSSAYAATITVGGKNFTEQQILASMTSQYLEGLGYDVNTRAGMGSAVLRQAQENGQIDVYWEYTGTSLINYNNISERLSAEETYERVKELDAEKGLVWLEPSAANNTYALAMREDDASERGIATLSELASAINDGDSLSFGLNAEFYARDDGWRPLMEAYDFNVGRRDISRMDSGLVYQALRDGQIDVGLVFATDGRIPAFGFYVLEDDKDYFPAYALTPVVRQETLDLHPNVASELNELSALLDDEIMAALNAQVDVERKSIENVSKEFLEQHDMM